MWYAETRLVRTLSTSRYRLVLIQTFQGPERIKGAYAYQTLLR
jgi:hypothetical protein